MEDKQLICDFICEALKNTLAECDLKSIKYVSESTWYQYVVLTFAGDRTQKINVSCDSGFGMIKDIVNHIKY